jgi:TPR repeat protein
MHILDCHQSQEKAMKHVKFLLAAIVMTVPTQSLGDSSYSITFINIQLENCQQGLNIKFRRCLERNDKKLKSAIETLNKDANKLKKRLKTLTTEVSNLETSIQGHADAQYSLGVAYEMGQGVPQDYVEAYKWFSLAAAGVEEAAIKSRDDVARQMTPAQITEAQRLAREWKPKR